jgi:hypothetical protein
VILPSRCAERERRAERTRQGRGGIETKGGEQNWSVEGHNPASIVAHETGSEKGGFEVVGKSGKRRIELVPRAHDGILLREETEKGTRDPFKVFPGFDLENRDFVSILCGCAIGRELRLCELDGDLVEGKRKRDKSACGREFENFPGIRPRKS